MFIGDTKSRAEGLDALFPGLAPAPAPRPRLVEGSVRAIADRHIDPATMQLHAALSLLGSGVVQRVVGWAGRTFGAYWAHPGRTLWTPLLAGAAVRLWELEPGLFPAQVESSARLLAAATPAPEPVEAVFRSSVIELVLAGAPLLLARWPEDRALADFGLHSDQPVWERVRRVSQWLADTDQPVAWVAALLPVAVAMGPTQLHDLLLARGPYRALGEAFASLGERQGISTWEEAVLGSIAYWRDPRGSAALAVLLRPRAHPPAAVGAARSARTTSSAAAAIAARVEHLEAELARAAREAVAAREEAEAHLTRVSTAQREAAEARQARDRAAERVRVLEAENADLRAALPRVVSAPPEETPPAPPAEPAVSASLAAPPLPSLREVFAGRRVYLYTGRPRAGAREAMRLALERHGALCEVFDGNRLGLLGPERFPADSLVIIDTSQLSHTASELVEERARASGVWCFVGGTGVGGLARRVAGRWWRSHPNICGATPESPT